MMKLHSSKISSFILLWRILDEQSILLFEPTLYCGTLGKQTIFRILNFQVKMTFSKKKFRELTIHSRKSKSIYKVNLKLFCLLSAKLLRALFAQIGEQNSSYFVRVDSRCSLFTGNPLGLGNFCSRWPGFLRDDIRITDLFSNANIHSYMSTPKTRNFWDTLYSCDSSSYISRFPKLFRLFLPGLRTP